MLIPLANFIGKVSDSRRNTALFSVGTFVIFGVLDVAITEAILKLGIDHDIQMSVQASLIGLAAGVVAFVLLSARRERRAIIRDEIERVVELNHRLRNSLQVITDAHYCGSNETRKTMMMDAVRSMDATLRQLFPALGIERRRQARQDAVQSELLQ